MKRTNPKFLKAFASAIGRIGQRALKPVEQYIKANLSIMGGIRLKRNGVKGVLDRINLDPFIEAAPFIIIIGEMLKDEESREGLITLIKTVESDDDLFAWINYLSLPADGWDSATPPVAKVAYNPPVDELNWANAIAKNTLGVLVPEAHANVRQAGLRVSAVVIRRNLKVLKGIPSKTRVSAIKKIRKGLEGINNKAYTKLAHTRQLALFTSAKGINSNAIRQLYRKSGRLRISPVIIMAAVAYLESRRYCNDNGGKDDLGGDCVNHSDAIINGNKLSKVYAQAFTETLLDEKKFGIAREGGNLFHIAMWAYKHLLHEKGNGLVVADVESK